jgi:NADP-dependent 3-hydroxy acid dehydrogenase YdfG
MKNLKEKTVLITGAASGIGRALAHKFNQIGAKTIIIDINNNELKETQATCRSKENCFEYIMDVSKYENWQALHKFLGEKNLIPDIVINNAGRAMSHVSINDVAIEDFEKIMQTNFWGVFLGTKEFLPDLLAKESQTAIINVSSAFVLWLAAGLRLIQQANLRSGVHRSTKTGTSRYKCPCFLCTSGWD